jgi:hypothetical protein
VLQNELKGQSTKIVLIAFDLLYLNGQDLRKLPLHRRKSELKKIVAGTDIQFSESFEIDGQAMFEHACKLGLEGVVSKVRDSTHRTGRSNDWVKKTCAQRETLTIAGFALDGSKWDGLYVGRRKGDDLVYAGCRPRLRQGLRRRLAKAIKTPGPENAALREADRAQGHLGRAEAAGRDRIPREVGGGQSPPSLLQGTSGGSLMDAFDRFWQWATKPLESQLKIPAELHRAVMELSPEARRDRAAVNQAAASMLDPER